MLYSKGCTGFFFCICHSNKDNGLDLTDRGQRLYHPVQYQVYSMYVFSFGYGQKAAFYFGGGGNLVFQIGF